VGNIAVEPDDNNRGLISIFPDLSVLAIFSGQFAMARRSTF
jgi:hypothetical protein